MINLQRITLCLIALLLLLTTCRPVSGPALPTEPPETASPPTGSLLGRPLQGSRPAIYRLMANGQLRHIDDWVTYLALGYTADDIIHLADEELATYPLGPPLTRWLTGQTEPTLYLLQAGQRYRLPNLETMRARGGNLLAVSLVPPDFMNRFPLAPDPLPALNRSEDEKNHPEVTAALWTDGFLWVANETGLLTRWDVKAGLYQQYYLPGQPAIRALAGQDATIYAGTETGQIWQLTTEGQQTPLVREQLNWVSALALDHHHKLWYADVNHFDPGDCQYRLGRGLGRLESGSTVQGLPLPTPQAAESDPARSITVLAFDRASTTLWAGTRFAGLLGYDLESETWQHYHTFNSALAENRINDLKLSADGTVWLATPAGVSSYHGGTWENHRLAEGASDQGALSLAMAEDGTVWVAGDHYIAWRPPTGQWQVYTAIDQPLLAARFQFVILDDAGRPWFLSRRGKIHFDGQTWLAYGADVRHFTRFTPAQPPPAAITPPPRNFPAPLEDYAGWLKTWPRPRNDNGRGMHFVQSHWLDEIEAQRQVNRLKRLGVRWALVNYANPYQLRRLSPLFAQAGITVVWRPFVRPYETYEHWAGDVEFLRSRGLAPYMQLYNEPSLAQEWDEAHPLDREVYLDHLLPAIRQVYQAGGYVGLQFIDPDWLRLTLQRLKSEGMAPNFDRLFFVPHPYGLNHPPEYDEDINSVLGFLRFARVFETEIGFVPVMIAGEGGWRPGEAQDNRYPPLSEAMHRDYHLALFDWFRTGQLSNGAPLPDYLFAFCPWLISDPHDPAAWFDSASGDRTLTIEAVEAMPSFTRKFSWDEQ